VLWMTHREYNGKPKLQDTINFVTVNVDLHAEFDCFKARMVSKGSSFVLVNELLSLYCSMCSLEFSCVQMTGGCYVRLSGDEMDLLIDWMVDLKGKYMEDGEALLSSLTGALLSFKTG